MEYVKGQENETDTGLDSVHNLETGTKKKKNLFSLQEECSRKQRARAGVGVGVGEELRCQ